MQMKSKVKKVKKKGFEFFLGILVGAAFIFTYEQFEKQPAPSAFPVLERAGYSIAYDTRGKIPFWTYEHLTEQNLVKHFDREGIPFQEDQDIYPSHRSTLTDYSKSGFDRGHIVPAANDCHSEEALKETFYLSNICPQHPKFNRGIWRSLEQHVRSLVKSYGQLVVISGPLFLSHEKGGKRFVTYEVIGENQVAVPTHFFKLIQAQGKRWAYVIPNSAVEGPLDKYHFSVEQLEKISGIRFDSTLWEKALSLYGKSNNQQ